MGASLNGFIKLHRKLVAWGWYQDYVVKDVFLHLLLTANFKDTTWKDRILKKGQVVVGSQNIANELGFTRQQVRTALKKLRSTNEITIEATNKFSIITIVNWEEYQSDDENSNHQNNQYINKQATSRLCDGNVNKNKNLKNSTTKITNKINAEYGLNTNNSNQFEKMLTNNLTNNQPTNNQQITNKQPQRKNNKNDKKGRREGIPTLDEIKRFVSVNHLNVDPNHFYEYYQKRDWINSRGQIIDDWQGLVRNWSDKEKATYANGYSNVKNHFSQEDYIQMMKQKREKENNEKHS